MGVNLLMNRRRMALNVKRAMVNWNNFAPPFSTELYKAYGTDTEIEDAGTGIIRQTWVNSTGGGYARSFKLKENFPTVQTDHVYYISYMFNAPIDGLLFSYEWAGGVIPTGIPSVANTWVRLSDVASGKKNGYGVAYFLNFRGGGVTLELGTSVLAKSPLYVDLTAMFGAGNEPTLAEFERQCRINGIDLTASHPQDSGTTREWIY